MNSVKTRTKYYFLDDYNNILEFTTVMYDGSVARNLSHEDVVKLIPGGYTFDPDRSDEMRYTVMFDGVHIKYEVTAYVPVKVNSFFRML